METTTLECDLFIFIKISILESVLGFGDKGIDGLCH